jgi:ATP-dependent DNA helicase RecQ
MAVVVSPLISLMKDQVDNLRDMGVPSCCLNSSLLVKEQRSAVGQILKGDIKILYLSPERLENEETIELLKSVALSFFIIDEAHCISHWGHDFRASYRNLRMIKERFKDISVHAFTATATREVQRDIIAQLGFIDPKILIGSIDRPNLTYRVMPRSNILKQVKEILQKHHNEAGIIYCLRRKDVDSVSEDLKKMGIDNVRYHAGMTDKDRRLAQDRFAREEVNIVVATVAFGMGIDRSNIRFIIHAGMPKSLEHYQQETGRAGRDRLPAFCYMFYGGADFRLWSYFAEESSEKETIMKKLRAIYDFCVKPQCRHKLLSNYFGEHYGRNSCDNCDYCLSELDMVNDSLIIAQKILSCVVKVRQERYGFGTGHVVNVLRGKATDKIENLGHHKLSTFGIMKEETENFVWYMIEQLTGQGFLLKDGEYLTLSVTEAGRQLLNSEITPVLIKPVVALKKKEIAKKAYEKRNIEWAAIDQDLFQVLRKKRAELAREKSVPAYIIFSDKTLRDIASKEPITIDDFSVIYGVGENKLKAYGNIFIKTVMDHKKRD